MRRPNDSSAMQPCWTHFKAVRWVLSSSFNAFLTSLKFISLALSYKKDAKYDYSGRNLKRVAEVWMDDYKNELYLTAPYRYKKIDPGDLTESLARKESLNCKPFQYFLDEIAPEICERFPPSFYGVFAKGAIISDADPNLCVSYMLGQFEAPLRMTACSQNKGEFCARNCV